MIRLIKVKSIRLSGLILGLIILFSSCKPEEDIPVQVTTKAGLIQRIESGALLTNFNLKNENYDLHFENETYTIPENEVKQIVKSPGNWLTILIYSDGSEIQIPSIGGDLGFIVTSVALNPSGYNPLAALIEVTLPTYGRIQVTVLGKNGKSGNITHLLNTNTPKQSIPVLGLYPNYNNTVELAFTDNEGNIRGTTSLKIQTEALPTNLPEQNLITSIPEKMEPGVNLVSYNGESEIDLSVPYMVDCNGDIRWILLLKKSPKLSKLAASVGLKRTKRGTFIAGDQNEQRIVELDMFGNLLKEWDLQKLGYIFHHELTEAENGNFLITVTRADARRKDGTPRINDIIIEYDPFNSSIVKEWDLVNIVDSTRILAPDSGTPINFQQNRTNWAHNNAITEMGENLVGTMRYQGIFSFTRTGKLRWLISPHKYWSAAFQPYLLTPVDEKGNVITDENVMLGNSKTSSFDWSWGPHTPVILSNDHILVFDNGYDRNWVSNWATKETNYSRVVEYKVNLEKKTVQQVWSFGQERGVNSFSPAMSGVQYLNQTKNVLFCPGMNISGAKGRGGRVIEIDPVTKQVLFEIELSAPNGTAFHRVTRMPLYPKNL